MSIHDIQRELIAEEQVLKRLHIKLTDQLHRLQVEEVLLQQMCSDRHQLQQHQPPKPMYHPSFSSSSSSPSSTGHFGSSTRGSFSQSSVFSSHSLAPLALDASERLSGAASGLSGQYGADSSRIVPSLSGFGLPLSLGDYGVAEGGDAGLAGSGESSLADEFNLLQALSRSSPSLDNDRHAEAQGGSGHGEPEPRTVDTTHLRQEEHGGEDPIGNDDDGGGDDDDLDDLDDLSRIELRRILDQELGANWSQDVGLEYDLENGDGEGDGEGDGDDEEDEYY